MLKKDLPACPVELTLLLISNKWKVLIIRDLLDGTKRFIGYSLKTLLDDMDKWGTWYRSEVN